jgi:hypothetical protein
MKNTERNVTTKTAYSRIRCFCAKYFKQNVCVVLCTVFRLIVVLFCVMGVVSCLCLIVVPLPPGENPFAIKINNKSKKKVKLSPCLTN